jgi:hypothetical protein
MSASQVNWVCFPCRTALREDRFSRRTPDCPRCGKPCVYLGDRVAIPRATAVKAWAKLKEACRARSFEWIDESLSRTDPLPCVLESAIDVLSLQPRSAEVDERITKLKDRLHKIRKKERAKRE